jgi:hypothetical protein
VTPPSAEFARVLELGPASRLLVIILDEGGLARAEEPRLWSTLDRLRERSLLLHGAPGFQLGQIETRLFELALALQGAGDLVAVSCSEDAPSLLPQRLAPERDLGLATKTPGHWWHDLSEIDQVRFAEACVNVEDTLWDFQLLRLEGLKDAGPWRQGQSRLLARGGQRAQAMNLALEELLRRAGSSASLMLIASSQSRPEVATSIYLAGPGVALDSLRPAEPRAPRKVEARELQEIAALLLGWRSASASVPPPEVELDPGDAERWRRGGEKAAAGLKRR